MKNRPSHKPKPEVKPDKRLSVPVPLRPELAIDGVPPTARRKLEEIGREIAGLRVELDRLAADRAREKRRKAARPSHSP